MRNKKLLQGLHNLLANAELIFPRFLRDRMDSEQYSIERFVAVAASKVAAKSRVLDAGAGPCQYRAYFQHTIYQSTDIGGYLSNNRTRAVYSYISDLQHIPCCDSIYDAIVNIQVLEHVRDPLHVLEEFYRILRPGGCLFLTAPQGWGLHGEPYHFFGFTKYGLELLFKQSGFEIISIQPRGGIFWYLSNRLRELPTYLYQQYAVRNLDGRIVFAPNYTMLAVLFPVFVFSHIVLGWLLPLLLFYMDRLDKYQGYTLGYACHCQKSDDNRSIRS
jgi:SAM-dependent methyltransferase